MDTAKTPAIEKSICKTKRQERHGFYQSAAACRPALFKYCRKLTGNPWDAEDLVQETLMVAYGRLADKHAGIQNLQSYLFKVATNQWISWCRRDRLVLDEAPAAALSYQTEFFSAQDSLGTLMAHLPPKERVALVLSEVFDSKNEEIAEIMGNTEGAVKAALSRAREKVKGLGPDAGPKKKRESADDGNVVRLAVEAFNRRDLESFARLFATNAVASGAGCFFETGIEEIKKGSLFFTVNNYDGKPHPPGMRAEVVELAGEKLFAIFSDEKLDDVWRLTLEDGEILRFDCYYCCPDVLREVAGHIGGSANDHGYWFEQKAAQTPSEVLAQSKPD